MRTFNPIPPRPPSLHTLKLQQVRRLRNEVLMKDFGKILSHGFIKTEVSGTPLIHHATQVSLGRGVCARACFIFLMEENQTNGGVAAKKKWKNKPKVMSAADICITGGPSTKTRLLWIRTEN